MFQNMFWFMVHNVLHYVVWWKKIVLIYFLMCAISNNMWHLVEYIEVELFCRVEARIQVLPVWIVKYAHKQAYLGMISKLMFNITHNLSFNIRPFPCLHEIFSYIDCGYPWECFFESMSVYNAYRKSYKLLQILCSVIISVLRSPLTAPSAVQHPVWLHWHWKV